MYKGEDLKKNKRVVPGLNKGINCDTVDTFFFSPKKARYHSQKSIWFILEIIYNTENHQKQKVDVKGHCT